MLFGPDALDEALDRLAAELSDAYDDGLVLVAVLKGSVPFLADLTRRLTIVPEVDFLAISSYAEGTGRVRLVKDLELDLYDRDVVLVEDIVDTGLTLTYLLGELGRREPRTLEVCALLDRTPQRIVPTPVRFRGFEVTGEFLIGYGLDYAGRYRNLDRIYAADVEELVADPDAYVKELFPG